MGHIIRCLSLADELRETHGCEVVFALREGPVGVQTLGDRGYKVLQPAEDTTDPGAGAWLTSIIDQTKSKALILDVRDDLPVDVVRSIRDQGLCVATIDDPSDRRLVADLAFYPPVPQVYETKWPDFKGYAYIGWPWVLIRRDITALRLLHFKEIERKADKKATSLLVTMGGSDPAGFTEIAINALASLQAELCVNVVLGPAFPRGKEIKDKIRNIGASGPSFEVHENPQNFLELVLASDLALAAFGVTAYELATLGVPALYFCLTEDHARSAQAFVDVGAGRSLGFGPIEPRTIARQLAEILDDPSLQARMRKNALRCIDGLGAQRIARKLMSSIYGQKGQKSG